MRITDINCFIGYDNNSIHDEYTHKMLIEKMNKYHIDSAVIYDKWAINNHSEGNQNVRILSEENKEVFSPCYVLSPNLETNEMPAQDDLYDILKNDKPAAVRLFPQSNGFIVDSFYAGELLEVINSLKLPLILEAGEGIDFKSMPELSKDFPDIPFVLIGVGLRCADYIIPLIKKRKNVYFDTSYTIDAGFLDETVDRYGSEKFLFGSGMPLMEPSGLLSMIIYGDFSNEHKENIFFKNWERLQEEKK